jgi:hypothetical protein
MRIGVVVLANKRRIKLLEMLCGLALRQSAPDKSVAAV